MTGQAQREHGIEHVRFYSVDGMSVSIDLQKATNPYGDVIVVYEMNDEPLPREHGFPIRMLVPGYAAIRNPKWVNKIELSKEDADSPFQRGLNYKVLPPSVVDANDVDLTKMPSITEASVYSGITSIERIERIESTQVGKSGTTPEPDDIVRVRVKGWAWAGGGRNVVRVDVTGDEGNTWATATLKEGSDQRFGRAWAWVFWECNVSVPIQEDGTVHVASKAVDMAFNSQPEKSDHMWNVRGLCNNSWYRAHVKVI
jgi:sulfite oxidase